MVGWRCDGGDEARRRRGWLGGLIGYWKEEGDEEKDEDGKERGKGVAGGEVAAMVSGQ